MAEIKYVIDPETGKYTDLYETNFPAGIDLIDNMRDLTADLVPYRDQWKKYMSEGNVAAANQILVARPELLKSMATAKNWNQLIHAVLAMERWINYNLDEWGNKKINNEIWIHDISIKRSEWTLQSDGSYKYIYSRSDITSKSIPKVIWDLDSRTNAMKMAVVPVTYDGRLELIAGKSPRGDSLTIQTLIIKNE